MAEETKSSRKDKLVIGLSLVLVLIIIFLLGGFTTGFIVLQGGNSSVENQSNNTSCTNVEVLNVLENIKGNFSENDEWETRVHIRGGSVLSFSIGWRTPDELELVFIGPTKSYTRTRQNELKRGVKVPAEKGDWVVKVFRNTKSSRFMEFELKVGTYNVECYEQILTPHS